MEEFTEEELIQLGEILTAIAHHLRFPQEEIEDCRQLFMEYLLRRSPQQRASIRKNPYRVAHHFAVSYLRRLLSDQKGIAHIEEEAPWNAEPLNPEDALLQQEFWERFEGCFASLRPEEQKLLRAHFVEQRRFTDIAKEQGRHPDAVRMACHRALKRLRETMESSGLTEEEVMAYLACCWRARGGGIDTSNAIMQL